RIRADEADTTFSDPRNRRHPRVSAIPGAIRASSFVRHSDFDILIDLTLETATAFFKERDTDVRTS
ncbi:MAG TPA: hypothetical protein VL475_01615, partial [Planctomycetaceae bacterium]|nr:hypothetical protein [Planctomycetaceae bacterium]